MKFRYCRMAAACALALAGAPVLAQEADAGIDFKFSGFGTLAASHTGYDLGDITGDVFQTTGAGRSRSTSFGLDTKLGLQLSAQFNPQWSAVVQVISKHQEDNTYTPMVEWANVRYAPTPELSVRAGRIALPALMNSEARFVGYATPWVRQPIEIYGTLAVTSNDGVDATYRHALGDGTNAVTAYAGNSTIKFKSGGGYTVKSRNAWGINDTYETGSLTLRAGYNALTLSIIGLDSGDELMGAFTQVAAGLQQVPIPTFQTAASQLLAVRDSNPLEGMKLSSFTLGANYDPGDWFVTAEAVLLRGDSFMVSSKGFVLGGGWRSHGWTPYAYVAKSLADFQSHPDIDTTGLAGVPGTEPLVGAIPMLMGGLDLMRQGFVSDQQTLALGVRWDFMKNAALKAQFERQRYGRGDGQLRQVPPGTSANGTSANVYSVAADFVF